MKRNTAPFYLIAPAATSDISTIATALVQALKDEGYTVGVFRPINHALPVSVASTVDGGAPGDDASFDPMLQDLLDLSNASLDYADCTGVSYRELIDDTNSALATILTRFDAIQSACDIVVVLGSAYPAGMADEFALNSQVAMNLGARVLLVESLYDTAGAPRNTDEVSFLCRAAFRSLRKNHRRPGLLIVNPVPADEGSPYGAYFSNEDSDFFFDFFPQSKARPATPASPLQEVANKHVHDTIDELLTMPAPTAVTPQMFQHQLLKRAKADKKRIVLPEGDDDRILTAADIILREGFADLTILGDPDDVLWRAKELKLNLEGAQIIDPANYDGLDEFVQTYFELRKHKGITLQDARKKMKDISYFATMMVHLGKADGMVSGAAHTTAHTIRPSFEIIKTKPGVSTVSSIFLMCLKDHVLAFGDCAVNISPTASQLADIAVSSAETASQFGVEPRVALLSYSTGSSGSGEDVDKVREAAALAQESGSPYPIEGPIQFDAAVDPTVAAAKAPDSSVAGKATVLVFPDLDAGNNTYKAVQRTAGAVAVGPILQGLKKPVNDLSRGALVDDIVNTVAVTATQAQSI